MSEVVMPRLSDSMEEGTILTWLKQVGDEVAIGDELVEIETDKANMAYEADVAGTLQEILAQEGETLPIGTPIARIGEGSNGRPDSDEGQTARAAGPVSDTTPSPTGEGPASSPPTAEAEEQDSEVQAPEAEHEPQADGERVKASPLARRLARDKGLDLHDLHGSGPGGRIVKHDVEEAAPPVGDAVGGTPPEEALATGRGGGSPAAAGPAGQNATVPATKRATKISVPA
jgi:pyruvate dehydrogenase E2 component (dihydrolipoamide acetyltransferase)